MLLFRFPFQTQNILPDVTFCFIWNKNIHDYKCYRTEEQLSPSPFIINWVVGLPAFHACSRSSPRNELIKLLG